jgi:hypothetical protein
MINSFKKGYYYRWIGDKNKIPNDYTHEMQKILSGRWYKCIEGINGEAIFYGIEGCCWDWHLTSNSENFQESKYLPKSKKAEDILKNWK